MLHAKRTTALQTAALWACATMIANFVSESALGSALGLDRVLECVLHRWFILPACACVHAIIRRTPDEQENDGNNEMCVTHDMLLSMCDAVVRLDSELRVTQDSPELSKLLTATPRGELFGSSILSFLATEADRQKFIEQVSSLDAATLPMIFHVDMVDSIGIAMRTEVLCASLRNVDLDGDRHFLGFRMVDTVGDQILC